MRRTWKSWLLAVALLAAPGLAACDGREEQSDTRPAEQNERSAPPVIPPAEPGTGSARPGSDADRTGQGPEQLGETPGGAGSGEQMPAGDPGPRQGQPDPVPPPAGGEGSR